MLRGLVYAVLALAAITGVRSWVSPAEVTQVQTQDPMSGFPRDQAAAVAARFTRSYLTWNENRPEAREAALRLDYAGGEAQLGWDGSGRQDTITTVSGQVRVIDANRGTVTVLALVQAYKETAEGPKRRPPVWRALEVPVALVSDPAREGALDVVVSGLPALVAPPAAVSFPAAPDRLVDSSLSTSTRGTAQAFFEAYAAGDVSAVTAPNAPVLAPPAGTVEFDSLASWSVFEAKSTATPQEKGDRDAVAVVRWVDVATGATLTQQYALSLTPVSSNGGTRWQVDALTGGQ